MYNNLKFSLFVSLPFSTFENVQKYFRSQRKIMCAIANSLNYHHLAFAPVTITLNQYVTRNIAHIVYGSLPITIKYTKQLNIFLGLLVSLFPDYWEFPFSHNFFFRYLGLSIAFAYHGYLCTSVKLYIMCGMLLMAVFPYAWLEVKLDSRQNTRKNLVTDTWHR